jgi:tetratricopeptide (TPR) repeat protein
MSDPPPERSPPRAGSDIPADPPQEQIDALIALYAQGRFDLILQQAEALARAFPRSFAPWQMLGAARFGLGQREQAAHAFRQACALKPDHAPAHNNLGAALYALGQLAEAIAAYQRAIALKPDHADAHNNLGAALYGQGKLEEAIAAHQRAIALAPDHADAHTNLGVALTAQGQLEDAIAAHRRAIALMPDYADAQSNLGNALHAQGRLEDAIAAHRRAIALKPGHADAFGNLGNALKDHGQVEEAIAAYRHAIALKPDHADAHSNLGSALYALGQPEEAIAACQRAIAITPDHADAHWNASLAWLAMGNFSAGWDAFEWRWRCKGFPRPRPSAKPLWLGTSALKGARILLWGEQGLGDQIQFARYAPRLAERGAEVILEVHDALVGLLDGLPGVSKVVSARTPVPDSDFDVHCPLMSLPLALGTELSTIPEVPRLTAHRQAIPRWAGRVPSAMPRIGIAWSGDPQHRHDRHRSLALSRLAPILTPSATWISLQKEVRAADRPAFDALARIEHFGAGLVETAALCEHCDLVISVDTSLAHLAATLGRPVWLLLPFAADFRWLRDRDDTPWYPSMTLYRQPRIGDWDDVLQRVGADLQAWLRNR